MNTFKELKNKNFTQKTQAKLTKCEVLAWLVVGPWFCFVFFSSVFGVFLDFFVCSFKCVLLPPWRSPLIPIITNTTNSSAIWCNANKWPAKVLFRFYFFIFHTFFQFQIVGIKDEYEYQRKSIEKEEKK